MIKDRNIGFWRIFSTSKTEKNPFYLKLVKFLCLVRNCQKRPKNGHFRCQIIFKYAMFPESKSDMPLFLWVSALK